LRLYLKVAFFKEVKGATEATYVRPIGESALEVLLAG
jgi:hypothetical protein